MVLHCLIRYEEYHSFKFIKAIQHILCQARCQAVNNLSSAHQTPFSPQYSQYHNSVYAYFTIQSIIELMPRIIKTILDCLGYFFRLCSCICYSQSIQTLGPGNLSQGFCVWFCFFESLLYMCQNQHRCWSLIGYLVSHFSKRS